MDKDAKELKWYTYKTKCVSWLPIILDSLNCYEMNATVLKLASDNGFPQKIFV